MKQPSDFIQEELEQRILKGLSCEWEEVFLELDEPASCLMQKPFFSLCDLQKKCGYWSAQKREIGISRNLAFNYPWDTVRDVLLHEMAHQYADEVLGAHHEKPHGRSFREACYLLKADAKAAGHFTPLHDRVSDDSNGLDDKIMLKVKKLMALAESRNSHEAEAAMAKAHELIARYNIDLIEAQTNRDYVSIFLGKPALRHFREVYVLSHLLIDYYYVDCVWVPSYVVEKGKMGRALEISGTVQNVKIAAYVFDFVNTYINSRWDQYKKNKRLNRYRKTDFAVGIIMGFRQKLKSQQREGPTSLSSNALVKFKDQQLMEYMAFRYPRLIKSRRGGLRQDRGVLNDGKKIGREMVISKGVEEKNHHGTFLLE